MVPRQSERLLTRATVLGALASGDAVPFEDFLARVVTAAGIPQAGHPNHEWLELPWTGDGTHDQVLAAVDMDLPTLARPRLRIAVTDAVAALTAEGVMVPAHHSPSGATTTVDVHRGNTSWGR